MKPPFPLLPMLALLLCGVASTAFASERVADILADLRARGYPSASVAISRLHAAGNAADPALPLATRRASRYALLRLAMDSGDTTAARNHVTALERMAVDEHCSPCRFLALLGRAQIAMRESSVNAARPYLAQAEALLPDLGDATARGQLLALRGNVEGQDHKLDAGIEYTMQALALAEAAPDPAEAVRMRGTLVWMNTDLGDLDRAISIGEDAYARAAAMDYRPMMARISLDLGHAYALAGRRDRQRAANERALALSADDPGLVNIHALSLNNLSDFHLSQPGGDIRALEYARRAEALARARQSPIHRAAPLTNMGIAQARMGRVDEGVARIREAIAIAEKQQVQEYVVGITAELVKVLEGAGRYREALAASHSVNAKQAELTRQQREKAVLELQEKYEAERKTREIAALSAQNALKQAQLEANAWRQRLWTLLAASLALGFLVLMLAMGRVRTANRILAKQSRVDPLTGVFNRRHGIALLARARTRAPARRATEPEASIGLMMLDLDYFKRINDTHGHAAGDAVLVETAARLGAVLRETDMVVRWGGEEFVLILPGVGPDSLPGTARKVLDAIGAEPMLHDGRHVQVTASIGALCIPRHGAPASEAALAVADAALYAAKDAGRNRAVCITGLEERAISAVQADGLAAARAAGGLESTTVTGPAPAMAEH